MRLSEVRTDIEHITWIRLLNDENSLKREQLCSLNYERGKLQLLTNGQSMMIQCTKNSQTNDIAMLFAKGYHALTEVTNIASNGTHYCLRIVYIHGTTIKLSNIDLALDNNTLEQAKKLQLGDGFKYVSQALKSRVLFQFDINSNDYYALGYLSQVAFDEIKQIEQKEQEALAHAGKTDAKQNNELTKTNNMVLIGDDVVLAVREYNFGEDTYLGCKRLTERKTREVNKAIRLIKLNLSFSDVDNPVVLQAYAKQQMQQLANTEKGYLNTWDKYGTEEGNLLLEKARLVHYISYTAFEPYNDGSDIEIFVDQDYRDKLQVGDALELVFTAPEYLENPEMTWEQYSTTQFDKFKKESGLNSGIEWGAFTESVQSSDNNGQDDKITNNSDTNKTRDFSDIINIKEVNQHSLLLAIGDLPESVKLIYSIQGDRIQVERRMAARERISQGTSAMPMLGMIIEEEGELPQREKANKIKPLTQHVESKIFPDNKPTAMQQKAIDIALNTPDIVIIQGPPGTGKTTVIAAIIERLNEISDKKEGVQGNILVSGYQHDAVDNILSRLSINSLPSVKFGKKSGIESNESSSDSKINFWRYRIAETVRNAHPELNLNVNYDSLHRLYQNYLSAPDTYKALRLLKQGLDIVEACAQPSLPARFKVLSDEISEQSRPKYQDEIRCVRALRVTRKGFCDDGPLRALALLNKLPNEFSIIQKSLLEKAVTWQDGDCLDILVDLKGLKEQLLAKFKEQVRLNKPKVRQDVIELIQDCLAYLETNTHIKDPQNKILSNYLFELENNPVGIKKAVSEYNFVYGATTGQSEGKALRRAKVGSKGSIIFDTVIIDEAARAAPRDLMIPMVQAESRIILVGDHRQLPHMIEDRIVEAMKEKDGDNDVSEQHIKHSMFEYLINRLKKLEKRDRIQRTITLDAQFRSHPLLGEFASDTFYQAHNEAYRSDLPAHLFSHQLKGIENKAAVWVDVPHLLGGEAKDKHRSTYRVSEAKRIAKHISEWLESEEGKSLSFGIISFYKAQVTEIFKALVQYGITEKIDEQYQICDQYKMLRDSDGKPTEERLRIGTVDSFQGMEFDIVLLSVVRSPTDQDLNDDNKALYSIFGHLMSVNRLCVSMTRQKKALIAFGDVQFILSDRAHRAIPQVEAFYKLCQQHGIVLAKINTEVEVA